MVCPLCEHEQEEGDSCDACGRPWAPRSAPVVTGEPLADLEPTHMVAAGPDVPMVALPRLERGREDAPPAPAASVERIAIDLTDEEEERVRCPNCGLLGTSSKRCFVCGVQLA